MQVKETQMFKLLELYQKFDHFSQSSMTVSSLKSPKSKTVYLQAFYILFCTYVIINPIRHIVTLAQCKKRNTDQLFVYSYIFIFRVCIYIFTLLKIFNLSKFKLLTEEFAEIKLENEGRKCRKLILLYSFTVFYAFICVTISSNIFIDFVLPCLSKDLLEYFTYPISNNIFKFSFLTIQATFNCISAVILIADLYVDLLIGFTLSYEFNKLANEAERFVTEKQSDHSNFIKKHKDITEICDAHNIMSRKLKFVNESLQLTSGFIVLSSILSSCVATYVIINDSPSIKISQHLYLAMVMIGCFIYLILLFWCGVHLNKSVHSITQSIHYMQFQGVDQEVVAKILVFLNRLTTESHGIDVGGCFVITPSSTLTMIGSFITYILVVIQTKPL